MKSKIFLDSGDPKETKEILELVGHLDGQTTNPTLIARNPEAKARLGAGNLFSIDEVNEFYKDVVEEISAMIPDGSVSIEVSADRCTSAGSMIDEGRKMNSWIPNAHIKLPTIKEGLIAAKALTEEQVRVNMTLVFCENQAAAVYTATIGAKRGDVFVSPFVGRLNDIGKLGLDIVENITQMYSVGDGHVEVLMASIRDTDSFVYAIEKGVNIITVPAKILREWVEKGKPEELNDEAKTKLFGDLAEISYENISLDKTTSEYDIQHDLTDKGLQKFADDWSELVSS